MKAALLFLAFGNPNLATIVPLCLGCFVLAVGFALAKTEPQL